MLTRASRPTSAKIPDLSPNGKVGFCINTVCAFCKKSGHTALKIAAPAETV